jgi:hypothetical protein
MVIHKRTVFCDGLPSGFSVMDSVKFALKSIPAIIVSRWARHVDLLMMFIVIVSLFEIWIWEDFQVFTDFSALFFSPDD